MSSKLIITSSIPCRFPESPVRGGVVFEDVTDEADEVDVEVEVGLDVDVDALVLVELCVDVDVVE